MKLFAWLTVVGAIGGALLQSPPRPSTATGEWPTYGADLASTKYSPIDQLTPQNFSSLRVAWRAPSPDGVLTMTMPGGGEWTSDARAVFAELSRLDPPRWRDGQPPIIGNFKATPLMVGGTLYLNTPLSIGAALDAATGRTKWVVQPAQLRVRHDDDEPAVEPAGRGLLAGWRRRGRTHLLGDGRRLSDCRGREDGPPGGGLWRQRARGPDGGPAAREARPARLPECPHLLGAVTAHRRAGRRDCTRLHLVARLAEGADPRLHPRLRRCARAGSAGRSTPCRSPASSATTRGRTTRGSTPAR